MIYRIVEKQKGNDSSIFLLQYKFMNKWIYCYDPITIVSSFIPIILLSSILIIFF